MDRTRILPPDPMEVAQMPIDGVDVPASEPETKSGEDQPPTEPRPRDQAQYVENEGLNNTPPSQPQQDVERARVDQDETARAGQRGRTA
jgi:hypothetical protein